MDKGSVSHLFLSQDIKQNVLLSFYLDSWWRHKRFFLDQPLKQQLTVKKTGEDENTKIGISREHK